jgi:hypothetical protein
LRGIQDEVYIVTLLLAAARIIISSSFYSMAVELVFESSIFFCNPVSNSYQITQTKFAICNSAESSQDTAPFGRDLYEAIG